MSDVVWYVVVGVFLCIECLELHRPVIALLTRSRRR